jgi:hypothetical protein
MDQSMEDILSAFRVLSDRSFRCAGEVIQTRGDSLITQLQECLYRLCYTRRFAGKFTGESPAPEADPALLRDLQRANAARTALEPGWRVEQIDASGKILASRNGISRWFSPGHFLTDKGPGFVTKEDGAVSIHMPRESTTEQRSFYMAFGETVSHDEEHKDVLRFYWNVSLEGAPRLMAALTRELNRFQVPYLFKCGVFPEMYERRDVAVLYVNRRYFAITTRIVAAVYARLSPVLQADTPLFTRPLARGLGFAEDPPDGTSFGMSRCLIVAETLRACYEQNRETSEQRLAELERQFRKAGIDPQHPELNPGSRGEYEFPAISAKILGAGSA